MTIEVALRDVEEGDLPIFFEQQRDPEATRMAAFPSRDRDAFMAHWQKIMREKAGTLQTILFAEQVAGNIVSWEQAGERMVGYWLGREYWGKGIATAALSQLLRRVTARPLIAHVAKHNIGSIRVLQKCGFTISGEERFPVADGKLGEEYILKLTAAGAESADEPRSAEERLAEDTRGVAHAPPW